MPTYEELGFGRGAALSGDRARSVFGHVMGLVAVTCGFAALGAYLARNAQGGLGIGSLILAFGLIFGLQYANAKGHTQLASGLLFGLGLLLGLGIGPIVSYYAKANPGAVYQAASTTGIFIAGLGCYGYTTRRDLAPMARMAFFGLLAVLVFGLIGVFVTIPSENIIYCVAALACFAVFTAYDFQRLARNPSYQSAVPIAANIFLDIFNVFLLLLSLFGGGGNRR